MNKMKAVICTKYGQPNVLELDQVNKPVPKADEVLVKIHATAATTTDGVLRGLNVPGGHSFPVKQLLQFAMRVFMGFTKPRNPILGLVFSGTVEATGEQIKAFEVGDEVFGFTGMSRGAYAEYKCVSQKEIDAGELFFKPANTSHEEAAAIVYGGVLATHFMKPANIKHGQKVLIYGASGAIGTIAIQLAKQVGAEVTAVCSTRNFKLVADLGADYLIDYTKETTVEKLGVYDFVLDAVGKNKTSPVKEACKKLLTPKGKYVSVDDGLLKIQPDYLPKLHILLQEKRLRAVIDQVYPLEHIVDAHEYLEQGHKRGNLVIQVA